MGFETLDLRPLRTSSRGARLLAPWRPMLREYLSISEYPRERMQQAGNIIQQAWCRNVEMAEMDGRTMLRSGVTGHLREMASYVFFSAAPKEGRQYRGDPKGGFSKGGSIREYLRTGYGLRFSTEIHGSKRGKTFFHEYLQEYCLVLQTSPNNIRKPPGVYGIM